MAFVTIDGNPIPAGAREDYFEGWGGVKLRTLVAPATGAARGSVLLCPGRTEFIEKYFEVIGRLQARGFAVLCLDWRGQGLSARAAKNPEKGHMRSLDDAARDLGIAVERFGADLPAPRIILAHSMGGAISLRALLMKSVSAAGAAFSAPMWGLPGLKGGLKGLILGLSGAGMGKAFAPGMTKVWAEEKFADNPVTHDEARHARCNRLILANRALALAGPTIGWVAASARAIDTFTPAHLKAIDIPVLVATAGEEMLVDNGAHARVAAALPHAKHITIAGAKHEILMETDALQAPFWEAFDKLADKVAPKA